MPTGPNPTEATSARVVKTPPPAAEFVGVVSSPTLSVISSQVSAPLVELNMATGKTVKAGDLVARFDETELQSRLDQARSNETSATAEAGAAGAQVANLRAKMNASAMLYQRRIEPLMAVKTSTAEYHAACASAAAAAAKASAARSAREQAEKDLAKTKIVAPISGIVTNLKAHLGEVPQVGTPLARVFDPSHLIIKFAVPLEHRAEVKIGQRVEFEVEGGTHRVAARVTKRSEAQEPPIYFTVVEADIDDTRLAPGEITVASVGRVRFADARGAKR